MIKILSFILSFLVLFGGSIRYEDTIYSKKLILGIECVRDIFCPDENVWVNGAQYPTIIELNHSGDNNGTLLASYEHFAKSGSGFTVMKSTDKGESWNKCARVQETLDPSMFAYWEPCLFELPETVGNYPAGTVLLGGVSLGQVRPEEDNARKSAVTLYVSGDAGTSWREISVIDEADGVDAGVWEPFFVYESGYLYCFYSDDADESHSQTVVYKKTKDLINWSEKVGVVVLPDTQARPGMPVLTKTGSGEYFLCYEVGIDNMYPIYFKISRNIEEWGEEDIGTPVKTKNGRFPYSGPSVVWLHCGGDGAIIVSGKGQNEEENRLFISYNNGKTFTTLKNPLPYSSSQGCGYSPSVFRSQTDENILYYANTVDYRDGLTKIAFSRIKFEPNKLGELFTR